MSFDNRILVGDVGGTHARFAVVELASSMSSAGWWRSTSIACSHKARFGRSIPSINGVWSSARCWPSASCRNFALGPPRGADDDTNVSTDTIVQSNRLPISGVICTERLVTGGGDHDPIRGNGVHRRNPRRSTGVKDGRQARRECAFQRPIPRRPCCDRPGASRIGAACGLRR